MSLRYFGQPLPISDGGTGASDATAAREAIGANDASNLTAGTLPNARLVGNYSFDNLTLSGRLNVSAAGGINFANNDFLTYDDGDNLYIFSADGGTGNAVVRAGKFTTVADSWSIASNSNGSAIYSAGVLAAATDDNAALYLKKTNANGAIAQFRRTDSTNVGNISVTTSSTAYNTSSDERLKEDFQPINPALLDAIKVYDFKWIGEETRGYGVKAQECHEVFPQATTYDEESDRWSADYSKFVPLLIDAVQGLRAEVASLRSQLDAIQTSP